MALSDTVGGWADELKKKMTEPNPFRAVHDKKEGVAKKMKAPTQSQAMKLRQESFKKVDTNSKGYTNRMNTHTLKTHEAQEYQKRIGRAYND